MATPSRHGFVEVGAGSLSSGFERTLGTATEDRNMPWLVRTKELNHSFDVSTSGHQGLDIRKILGPARPQLHEHQDLDTPATHRRTATSALVPSA